MNPNTDRLPPGCDSINGWKNITVRAGHDHAKQFNGLVFTYDTHEWRVEPCQKVAVKLVNEDSVRHQWMVHGLPISIHGMMGDGMFNVEVTGPANETGTFIAPSYEETLLVHCGMPQHEERGMKGQLVIGSGDGDLAGIPGISGSPRPGYTYPQENALPDMLLVFTMAFLLGGIAVAGYRVYA